MRPKTRLFSRVNHRLAVTLAFTANYMRARALIEETHESALGIAGVTKSTGALTRELNEKARCNTGSCRVK